ncbi:hypothetical protein [Helicobacter acinonychis]|uniref:hypothetical protein n=1 Tax=Helicobacter acinonychis TaxID=212 RepID=UPI000CF14878|nr:hypothetical protein [Helicobacter acinonychis]
MQTLQINLPKDFCEVLELVLDNTFTTANDIEEFCEIIIKGSVCYNHGIGEGIEGVSLCKAYQREQDQAPTATE